VKENTVVRARQRLAAYGLIIDDSGRVLLARQSDADRRLGPWILPGGGVEHGEHPEEAALREVEEETGLQAQIRGLTEVLSDITIVGRRRRLLHNVRLIYRADLCPGRPALLPPRPGDAGWFAPPEVPTLPLAPFTAAVLGRAFASEQR
jgi:8-oxo-dGTP diphosphatase